MDHFELDLKNLLYDIDEEVDFYLRRRWPAYEQLTGQQTALDNLLQRRLSPAAYVLFEDYRYLLTDILADGGHRCWVGGLVLAVRGYLGLPLPPVSELPGAVLPSAGTPSLAEQRQMLAAHQELRGPLRQLLLAAADDEPLFTAYSGLCLELAQRSQLCCLVHGYESCNYLLAQLGYENNSPYSRQLSQRLADSFR